MPPEIAAVFRAIATLEGTLTQLTPSFDVIAETRAFASAHLADQLRPDALRASATDELTALLPLLRRLFRRLDRLADSLEAGRLGLNVRLFADKRDRRVITELLHQVLITFLASTTGIMAVLMLGLRGGPGLWRRSACTSSSATACWRSQPSSRCAYSYWCFARTGPDQQQCASSLSPIRLRDDVTGRWAHPVLTFALFNQLTEAVWR